MMGNVEIIRHLKRMIEDAERIVEWQEEIYTALHNINAEWIVSGTISLDRLPNIPRSKIPDFFNSPFWNNIPDKPSAFPPLAHTHYRSDITDFWSTPFWNNIPDKPAMLLEGLKGTGTTDANGDASITFPVEFTTPPLVFLQSKDASARGIVLDVVSVTTTGFTVKARKVTGITTSSAGSHTHSFTPSGSISTAGAHSHSFTPSGTISNAGSHSHSFTPSGSISSTDLGSKTSGGPSATRVVADDPYLWSTLYAASSIGGTPDTAFKAASSVNRTSVATDTHTHSVTLGSHSHTFTGSSGTTDSAGDHSHTFTGSSGTTSSAGDHSHTFTGSSGTTGSAGAHTHTVDAPVLSVDFMWVAIKV